MKGNEKGEGGWCGCKWNHRCLSSPSSTFNLGRFDTKKKAKICANPEEKWVKRAVRVLLKKKGLPAP